MVRSDERRISGFPHSIIWEGRSVANIGYIFGSGARSVVRSIVKRVEVAIIKGKYAEKVISIRSVSRYGRKYLVDGERRSFRSILAISNQKESDNSGL